MGWFREMAMTTGSMGGRSVVAVVLLLVASAIGSEPKDFVGDWVLDRGRTESLEKAVDLALEPENLVVRMVARKRILRAARSPETMRIASVGEAIQVTTESHAPPPVAPGGTPVIWMRPKGSPVKIRLEMAGSQMLQVFETESGTRLQRFSLGGDKNQLVVHVEVSSPRLQRKVAYRVAFVRAPRP